MTAIATTMETQICKIALRKLTQRLAVYGLSNSMPVAGQIICLGLLVYDLFKVADFYYQNKSNIDAQILDTITKSQSDLFAIVNYKREQLNAASGGGKPPGEDWIEKILKFCEKVKDNIEKIITGKLTPEEQAIVRKEAANEVARLLGWDGRKFLIPLTLLLAKPVNASEKILPYFEEAGNQPTKGTDPIIFDLNRDGILETIIINNGKYFDYANDGFAELTSWVAHEDGILVIDSNNNSSIDNISEILTHEILSQYDSNVNGIIDSNDTNFSDLKILKGDGCLLSLNEVNISSINLSVNTTNITDENENYQFAQGSYVGTDGVIGEYGEFLLNSDTSQSVATTWLEETEEIAVSRVQFFAPNLVKLRNLFII